MPLNPYIQPISDAEKRLHEDLIIEAIRSHGVEVYYIPRKILEIDGVLNEIRKSKFDKAYQIEMYIDTIDGYEGDGHLMSKFGFEMRDQIRLVCSRRVWNERVGIMYDSSNGHSYRPLEGDLVYIPMTQALMELKYVDGNQPFYQLSNMPAYKLTFEMFEFSDEKLETGVQEIDRISVLKSAQVELTISSKVGSFRIGETIQSDESSPTIATVVSQTGTTKLIVSQTEGSWAIGASITGAKSGSTAIIDDVEEFENIKDYDDASRNNPLEDATTDLIDFTETNPFGEPNFKG